jgi:hypothetical protein
MESRSAPFGRGLFAPGTRNRAQSARYTDRYEDPARQGAPQQKETARTLNADCTGPAVRAPHLVIGVAHSVYGF